MWVKKQSSNMIWVQEDLVQNSFFFFFAQTRNLNLKPKEAITVL